MIPLGDDNSQRIHPPVVTITLIVINALVFLLELGQGSGAQMQLFFQKWCVIPREYALRTDLPPLIPVPFWFTLFTSMFMHGGWCISSETCSICTSSEITWRITGDISAFWSFTFCAESR